MKSTKSKRVVLKGIACICFLIKMYLLYLLVKIRLENNPWSAYFWIGCRSSQYNKGNNLAHMQNSVHKHWLHIIYLYRRISIACPLSLHKCHLGSTSWKTSLCFQVALNSGAFSNKPNLWINDSSRNLFLCLFLFTEIDHVFVLKSQRSRLKLW